MKASMISICAYVVVTLTALSQNPPANPTPPANPVSPVNPTQPQPQAPVGRNQLTPGFPNRAVTAGLSNQIRLGAGTNAFLVTNQFGLITNRFATNRFASLTNRSFGSITNQRGVTGFTNQAVGGNSISLTNQNGIRIVDQAVTAADQTLLVDLRQAILPRLQVRGPWAPIAFQVREGVVTLLGTVQTFQIRQQVELLAAQTPGVVRVINQVVVDSAGQTLSQADFGLLTSVREAVVPQMQVNGVPAPVDFKVQQGVVTITGTVPSIDDAQRVVTLVQQVPGVAQVINQTTVAAAVDGGQTNTLGEAINVTNNIGSTNLSPTGRTTNGLLPQPNNASPSSDFLPQPNNASPSSGFLPQPTTSNTNTNNSFLPQPTNSISGRVP
jgi:osmotically-inducible protein OsmY